MYNTNMKIPTLIRAWRKSNKHTLKQVALDIGIPLPTLCRIEQGKPMDGRTLLLVLRWMLYDD